MLCAVLICFKALLVKTNFNNLKEKQEVAQVNFLSREDTSK